MIACCKENGVKLGSVFQHRTYDGAIRTKETILNGDLGMVTLTEAWDVEVEDTVVENVKFNNGAIGVLY